MLNERIISSWSKITPDDTTHDRILSHILDRVHSGETKKRRIWKILAPVTACLIIALTITVPIYSKGRH